MFSEYYQVLTQPTASLGLTAILNLEAGGGVVAGSSAGAACQGTGPMIEGGLSYQALRCVLLSFSSYSVINIMSLCHKSLESLSHKYMTKTITVCTTIWPVIPPAASGMVLMLEDTTQIILMTCVMMSWEVWVCCLVMLSTHTSLKEVVKAGRSF